MIQSVAKYLLLFALFPGFSIDYGNGREPGQIVELVASHWQEIHDNFKSESDVWGNYTLDLSLEALVKYDMLTGQTSHIDLAKKVMRMRHIDPSDTIPYQSQPFCSVNFTLGEATGNSEWFTGYKYESYKMYHEAKRSPEGAILINNQGGHYMLIDYMQEYASRMAKTGYLTGDSILFTECVNQFILYEKVLRDKKTGLWSQGRGWLEDDPQQLSPGAWSRGHGWLLRGLVTSMAYLPASYRLQLLPVLHRLTEALLRVQDKSGMWHILLDEPLRMSEPDVSGTGMIDYYMALAVEKGWLDKETFASVVLKSTATLSQYVSDKGEVLSSSKGPGPLRNKAEYRGYHPEKDEKHGFQGIIYGMMGEMILNRLTVSQLNHLPVDQSTE